MVGLARRWVCRYAASVSGWFGGGEVETQAVEEAGGAAGGVRVDLEAEGEGYVLIGADLEGEGGGGDGGELAVVGEVAVGVVGCVVD